MTKNDLSCPMGLLRGMSNDEIHSLFVILGESENAVKMNDIAGYNKSGGLNPKDRRSFNS
jgi:hypothetical protein